MVTVEELWKSSGGNIVARVLIPRGGDPSCLRERTPVLFKKTGEDYFATWGELPVMEKNYSFASCDFFLLIKG